MYVDVIIKSPVDQNTTVNTRRIREGKCYGLYRRVSPSHDDVIITHCVSSPHGYYCLWNNGMISTTFSVDLIDWWERVDESTLTSAKHLKEWLFWQHVQLYNPFTPSPVPNPYISTAQLDNSPSTVFEHPIDAGAQYLIRTEMGISGIKRYHVVSCNGCISTKSYACAELWPVAKFLPLPLDTEVRIRL